MKSDDELLRELNRYRPVGPPPRLRDRVLQMKQPARTWPWAVAAAALLALSVALNAGARRIEADTSVLLPASERAPDPFDEVPAGLRAMAEREAFFTRLEQGDARAPVDPTERR
jgi:hypothetical protein